MKAAKVLGFSEDINSGGPIPNEARKSQNGGSPPKAADLLPTPQLLESLMGPLFPLPPHIMCPVRRLCLVYKSSQSLGSQTSQEPEGG